MLASVDEVLVVGISERKRSASARLQHLPEVHHRLNLVKADRRQQRQEVMFFHLRMKAREDIPIGIDRFQKCVRNVEHASAWSKWRP